MGSIWYLCCGIIEVEHEYKALLRAQERLTIMMKDLHGKLNYRTQLLSFQFL